jgi:hypothetical protein
MALARDAEFHTFQLRSLVSIRFSSIITWRQVVQLLKSEIVQWEDQSILGAQRNFRGKNLIARRCAVVTIQGGPNRSNGSIHCSKYILYYEKQSPEVPVFWGAEARSTLQVMFGTEVLIATRINHRMQNLDIEFDINTIIRDLGVRSGSQCKSDCHNFSKPLATHTHILLRRTWPHDVHTFKSTVRLQFLILIKDMLV